MKDTKAIDLFQKASVPQAVLKNALPAIAAMLMVLVYNLADTFFIGQTHNALQVAAISLAMPVFLVFTGVGTLFGMGGTSVISRALGENRLDYARKVCSFCMWSCVGVGVILAALFLVFIDEILSLVGASPDTWEYAKTYLIIVSISGPFALISTCYSNVIRAEGQATQAMMGQVLGNLLNIILDPLLILGTGWNVAGAAVATAIGNAAGAIYYICYFLMEKSSLSISFRNFTMKDKVCTSVLMIGIPAALGSVLMSVSQILVNSQMTQYGDMAIAGMGVAMKIVMITSMICMGLGQGVQPLLGYCTGARLWSRFRSILRFSLVFSLILAAVLTGLCYLFLDPIIRAFLSDPDAFSYAVQFARILLSTGSLIGILYVLINTLQAMGAATPALVINLSRQGIIFIPVLFLLKAMLGLVGLVWAQPVADLLSLVLAWILYVKVSRKMMHLDKEMETNDEIESSIKSSADLAAN